MSLRCPFAPAEGASSSYSSSPTASVNRISSSPSSASPLSSRERVIILYEQYIHLSRLQEVSWLTETKGGRDMIIGRTYHHLF